MKKTPNQKAPKEQDPDKSESDGLRHIGYEIYDLISPRFLQISGILIGFTITFYFTHVKDGAWFSGCLAIFFFVLFILDFIRHQNTRSPILRKIIVSLLMMTATTVLCWGIMELILKPSAPIKPTESSVNPIQSSIDSTPSEIKKPNTQQTTRESKLFKPKKDTSNISIGSGSVVSINQQGGITAGTVNINKEQKSTLNITRISEMVPADTLFVSTYMAMFELHSPVNYIGVEARSHIVFDVAIEPPTAGAWYIEHGNGGDSIKSCTIYRPVTGNYRVIIRTTKMEPFALIPILND